MTIHDQLAVISVVLGFLIAADTARDIVQGPYRRWLRRRLEAERAERDAHLQWVTTFRAATVTQLAIPAAVAAVRNAKKFQEGMDRLVEATTLASSEFLQMRDGLMALADAVRPKPGPGFKRPSPGPGHQETQA